MSHHKGIATRGVPNNHSENLSDDSLSGEEQMNNPVGGFEERNRVYELTSQVNALSIQKEQLIISYENALNEQRKRAFEVGNINERLTNKSKALYDQNEKLRDTLDQVASQNETLTRQIESLKEQVDSLMSQNRRTAEFHHSGQFDQLEIIKQLTNKDQQIKKLQQELQQVRSTDGGQSRDADWQASLLRQENQQLIRKMENNKKREIDIKRQYESLLQSKEQIIRKIATQSEQHSKSMLISKDKSINELRRQLTQTQAILEQKKNEIRLVNEKYYTMEKEGNKIRRDFKRKEDELVHQHEVEKQEIIKSYSEKIKNYLKDKEEKIQTMQMNKYEADTEIGNLKAELNRLRNQISSTGQLNSYLENANKENEFMKKKMQDAITEKDKQISQYRQQAFNQTAELKKTIAHYKKQVDQNNNKYEEVLAEKDGQIEKLQTKVRKLTQHQQQQEQQHHVNFKKSIEALKTQNEQLRASLNRLTQKYQEKNEKLHALQISIKKQYEERIEALQSELIKVNDRANQQKSMGMTESEVKMNNEAKEQADRLKMVNEILEMEKMQKEEQCGRAKEKLQQSEKTVTRLQNELKEIRKDIKDKGEDYRLLEHAYEQLQQKYKEGVKDLHGKIEEMNDQLNNEKKKNDKRKNEYKNSEEKLLNEVKKLKMANQDLEEEVDNLKSGKGEDVSEMEEKIEKLAHEISIINKERESMAKANEEMTRKKVRGFEDEREKMLEYINELEEKSNLLASKVSNLEVGTTPTKESQRQLRDLKEENYSLKVELSESLKEINELLQKYKDMEEKLKETESQQEFLRDKFDTLHERYRESCREKNRVIAELDTSYDQIQKLNSVLREKQREISSSRIGSSHISSSHIGPSHIAERDVSPTVNWRKSDVVNIQNASYSPRPIVSPQQINMASNRGKTGSSRIENSALRKEMKRYY